MTTLARKLRVVDYFTLGWGTMVGVGWLVVMDDWLLRGGALGACSRIRHRRRAAAAHRLRLRPAGHGHARRRRRGRLHRESFSPVDQLRHRLDDGAGLLHRLSVGSRRRRQNCRLTFSQRSIRWSSIASPDGRCTCRTCSSGWGSPGFSPAQLSRHPAERDFPELDYLRHARALSSCSSRVGVSKGSPHNFPPLFTHSGFVSVLLVMQIVPYFMTGFESVAKASGGSQSGISLARIFHRDLDGHRGRHSLLHHHHRRRRLCRSLAGTDGREIHDGGGLPARGGLALDCQRDSGGGVALAFQSVSTATWLPPAACCLPWDAGAWWMPASARCIRAIRRLRSPCSALELPPRRACSSATRFWCRLPKSARWRRAAGWLAACAAYYRM